MKPMLKRTNNNSNNRTGKFTRTHRHPAKSGAAQRNNLQQNFEKYITLAREATSTGDRVLAESYYQFAEHYLRTLNDIKPIEIEPPLEEELTQTQEGEEAIAGELICEGPSHVQITEQIHSH
jgi:hypothetical protein